MKIQTGQKLMQATIKLISEKGYLGATTREIAQEAGVTELTLFRHFGSKEKLFEKVLNSYTFLPTLKELLPELERLPYEEALTVVATRFLKSLKERKSMIRIMHSEINLYPDKIRGIYTKSIDDVRVVLAAYFGALRKKGVFRDISPETAARVFLSILFSYFRYEEIVRGHDITKSKMEKSVREFTNIFMYGTVNDRQ